MPAVRVTFLSIQAQDFIEDDSLRAARKPPIIFLSIQAQDFIEDAMNRGKFTQFAKFLSIQAQDFIEELILVQDSKQRLNS